MTEQEQVLEDLSADGVVDAITWAQRSTYRRVLADLSREAGYKNSSIGTAAYDVMVDRLDRVCQCGPFEPDPDAPEGGSDVLYEGLHTDEQLERWLLPSGQVVRDDANGSQGWRSGRWRWLRASFKFDKIDEIRWPTKSFTKQRVAQQPYPEEDALFSVEELEELGGMTAAFSLEEFRETLVLAHSADIITGQTQLFLGRPRWNVDGGPAWHWRHDLLGLSPEDGRGQVGDEPFAPMPTTPSEVADAPVRLRPAGSDPAKRARDHG
ncbi:hypothetical protein [Salinactinospora qingdaonensis]|uniref:Uncharacterized protein n=1 Tax=Salinactinospora qingdaonensis TaxID=702744 RepID=A0ABP7FAP3_9ACTN